MTTIADPLTLACGQTIPNRLCKAAMTEGLADVHGAPDERLVRLYTRWAQGGAGLLLTGNVIVDAGHLERAGNVIIDRPPSPEMQAGLKRWAEAAKSGGGKVWMQLSHGGRQTSKAVNPHPQAPSAIKLDGPPGMSFGEPVALDAAGIEQVIERFVQAAKAAQDCGFDGVQIHAAHGYLLSQFLSPKANRRQDEWGGSLENRARLLLTIVERVKAQAADGFAVAVKLNSADFQRGAFDAEDSERVAGWLDERGIDLLEVSGGTYEDAAMMGMADEQLSEAEQRTAAREAYFLDFAPRMRAAAPNTALMVTGGFRSRGAMNTALSDDGIDMIGLGRPLLAEPNGATKLLGNDYELPRIERDFRIGPGWLSPQSPFKIVKMLNMGAVHSWTYEQMDRMGEGLEPDSGDRVFKALGAMRKRDAAKLKAMQDAGTVPTG